MSDVSTVFVVDDDEAVRKSIGAMLQSVGLQVEVFDSPASLLNEFAVERSGCMVLDFRLPGMNGLELHRQLVERGSRLPFIIVTGHGEVIHAVEAMHRGAVDFIEKPYSRQQLLDRIRQALERDNHNRRLEAQRKEVRENLETLTEREREVLALIMHGKVTKEVAKLLGVSPKTVEVHRSNLAKKMNVDTISELVVKLVRLQLDVLPRTSQFRR